MSWISYRMLTDMDKSPVFGFEKQNKHPDDDKISSSWEEFWALHEKNLKSLRGKQQQQNILLCYPGTYVSILE